MKDDFENGTFRTLHKAPAGPRIYYKGQDDFYGKQKLLKELDEKPRCHPLGEEEASILLYQR